MTAARFVLLVCTRILAVGVPVQALLGAVVLAAIASAARLPLALSIACALALALSITVALQLRVMRASRVARTVPRAGLRRSGGTT